MELLIFWGLLGLGSFALLGYVCKLHYDHENLKLRTQQEKRGEGEKTDAKA